MSIVEIGILVTAALLIITGLYCLVRTYNIIRIIISVEIAMKAVTLLLAFAGWVNGGAALAQTFVITMIVIEVVVAVVAAGIAISVFRHNGSMDIRKLKNLRG